MRRIEAELVKVEKQIFDLESAYLEETAGANAVKGWSSFSRAVQVKKPFPISDEDRIFSLSSLTSPLSGAPWPAPLRSAGAHTPSPADSHPASASGGFRKEGGKRK